MNNRARQLLIILALIAPVAYAAATAPPFVAESRAQSGAHMLGPNFPIIVDANGDGRPDAGDESLVPVRTGATLTMTSRWDCNTATPNTTATLSNPGSDGRFRTVGRTNNTLSQSSTATGFGAGGPNQFSFLEVDSRDGSTVSGTASLVDTNGNGIPDLIMIAGGVSGSVGFTFANNTDYISVPWSQASVLGVDFSQTCGGTQPQIWIPLADTNGDGQGDTIVFDLDGNGVADPDLLTSPRLAAPPAPALGTWARLALVVLIGLTASYFLSRRQRGIGGATA